MRMLDKWGRKMKHKEFDSYKFGETIVQRRLMVWKVTGFEKCKKQFNLTETPKNNKCE